MDDLMSMNATEMRILQRCSKFLNPLPATPYKPFATLHDDMSSDHGVYNGYGRGDDYSRDNNDKASKTEALCITMSLLNYQKQLFEMVMAPCQDTTCCFNQTSIH